MIQHAGGDAGDAIQRCRKHGKWISHLPVRSRSRRVFDVQHLLSSTPGPGAMCCWALSFCKSCIHAELSVRNSCPIDRQTLEVKDLITNRSLAGVIDNLAVRCPTLSCSTGSTSAKRRKIRHSEENVCEWTSTLQEISNHLEECGWTEVRCSNPGCPEIVLRAMLPPHLSTCPEGHVPCQWYVR